MIWFYRIVYLPLLLIALPYYLFRMWRRGGYRRRFSNRFGLNFNLKSKAPTVKRIWIQAVSVGELLAIEPLLKQLSQDPSLEIVLTTTTSTGLKVAEDKYAKLAALIAVFPLDFYFCSRAAWKAIEPDLAILMESELWPEHLAQASKREVPVLLLNARLSDNSFRRQQRLSFFSRPLLKPITRVLASSTSDRDRLTQLPWAKDKLHFTGNLKFDVNSSTEHPTELKQQLCQEFGFVEKENEGQQPLVLLGASTWPSEEEALVEAYLALKAQFSHLRLLIVPRHAERKPELVALLQRFPIPSHFRTDSRQAPYPTEIYVADTTGELRGFTQIADIVFVGKSLPPHEQGQSPIEAAAFAKPILFGPVMSNFRVIANSLVEDGVALRVASPQQLTDALLHLLESPEKRVEMQEAAKASFQRHRGATQKSLEHIYALLS